MTYRTPESLIRQIMSEGHAPALKIPEPDRVADALKALHANGVTSAKAKDSNTITVDPNQTEMAINVMNNAYFHGQTQANPKIVSSNSIDFAEVTPEEQKPASEPHPPEGGQKLGEEYVEVLHEAITQLDEISHETRGKWLNATWKKHLPHSSDEGGPNRDKPAMSPARQEVFRKAMDKHDAHQTHLNKLDHEHKLASRTPQVHDLRHMSHGEVYDHTQTHEHIHDGDVLHVKGGVGVMLQAWPTMVHGESKALHRFKEGSSIHTTDGGIYHRSGKLADDVHAGTHLKEDVNKLDINTDGERTQDVQPAEQTDGSVNIELNKRSLVNRMEQQLKKIDENAIEIDPELDAMIEESTAEDIKQLDEISKNLINKYLHKSWDQQDHLGAKDEENKGRMEVKDIKRWNKRQRGEASAYKALDKKRKAGIEESVEQIDEISYSTLKRYEMSGRKQISDGQNVDKRKAGLENAQKAKIERVRRAAFAEEKAAAVKTVTDIVEAILLDEAAGLRLKATIHSDCGKHTAKIYKDHEWGEHRVKFMIHGKHHEPGDYHTNDYEDAHGTAKHELARLTKLNGALKEATEEEVQEIVEDFEQIDELSKALLGRYLDKNAEGWSQRVHDRDTVGKPWTKKLNDIHNKRYDGEDLAVGKLNGKGSSYHKGPLGSSVKKKVKVGATNEEVQIDEISQKGLKNYIGAAHNDVKSRLANAETEKDYDKVYDRERHMEKAGQKHDGKLADYKSKAVQGLYTMNHWEHKDGSFVQRSIDGKGPYTHQDAKGKRTTHANRDDLIAHVNKLHEDVQLDELSDGTLRNYVNKAAHDSFNQGTNVASTIRTGAADPFLKKFKNRLKGVKTATEKLSMKKL